MHALALLVHLSGHLKGGRDQMPGLCALCLQLWGLAILPQHLLCESLKLAGWLGKLVVVLQLAPESFHPQASVASLHQRLHGFPEHIAQYVLGHPQVHAMQDVNGHRLQGKARASEQRTGPHS